MKTDILMDNKTFDFDFDGEFFCRRNEYSEVSNKYKNFLRNNKVAIIIDDLGGVDPPGPRGIYSSANTVVRQGEYWINSVTHDTNYIRINPKKK